MDVGGWLRRLGLEQYEAAFRENKIDDTVLPSLTWEDLKDLGVAFVGHRRKLLDAISALCAEASAPTRLSKTPLRTDKVPTDTAERRQVTVMFADLVGATGLSARMDPEDLREVISAYQTCVSDTMCRFGGFVAKYMGDGVLYSSEEARRVAGTLLPDIMRFEPGRAASYPSNGRALTDDVLDGFISILTNGKVTTDGVGPHSDLLTEFPLRGTAAQSRNFIV
jgi:hypothetical protein